MPTRRRSATAISPTRSSTYLGEVKKLADDRRAEDRTREKLIADGAFQLASDPLEPVAAAAAEATTPHIELAALEDAVDQLKAARDRL